MKKTAILLAAFGSGSPQGESTLRLVRDRVRDRFPDIPVRWAFTSLLMCRRLAVARKKTDSVAKALQKLSFERYSHVAVQSLHAIPGAEYSGLVQEVHDARKYFRSIDFGAPLLSDDADSGPAVRALLRHIPAARLPHEHVVFMGHGTKHMAHAHYESFASCVNAADSRVHIGTMDGNFELEAILPRLMEEPAKVWLLPLLSVVGRHATEDMAGADDDSWCSRIKACGLECEPVLHGLAESADFVDLWLDNLAVALKRVQAVD